MPPTIGSTHCRPIGAPIPGADDIAEGPRRRDSTSRPASRSCALPAPALPTRSVFADRSTAMAGGLAFHPDGRLLVCVAGRGLAAVDAGGQQTWLKQADDQPLQCLTERHRHARRQHLPDRRQ